MENVVKIDFNKYSQEELDVIIEKAKEQKQEVLDRTVTELSDWKEKAENRIKTIENDNRTILEENEKLKIGLSEVKDKTDVLEFEDKTTLGNIKKQAKSRITYLLGGKGTPQYNLLFRSCVMSLYGNIGTALAGGKAIGKIKTEFGQGAIAMSKTYHLDKKHIIKFVQGLQKENEKGYLTKEKSKVLEDTVEWLEGRGIM